MKIKILVIALFILSLVTPFTAKTQAAENKFSFSESSTWQLKSDATISVATGLKVTNLTSNYYATAFSFWLPADSISNVVSTYVDGTPVEVKQTNDKKVVNGLSYDYQRIDLSFSKQMTGIGGGFSINLSYLMTGALKQKGQTYELVLPNFSEDASISESIVVKSPKNFGAAHFLTDDPQKSTADAGFNYFTFSDQSLSQRQQIIDFGETMSRRLDFSYPLENDDILPSFFKLYLPMESDHQSVFVKSVEPQPYYMGKSGDSNFMYFFLMPGQSVNVKADVEILTTGEKAVSDQSGKISEIPAELGNYTQPAKYWETTDLGIRAKATELIKPSDSVYINAKRVYDFVVSDLTYDQAKIQDNVRVGAAGALKRPDYVVCQEYADLFVTLLRSGGIPAREYYGMTDSDELKASETNILHAWADVYIPKYGWLIADPTWGEAGIQFGKMAFDHLAIDFDSGDDFSRPVALKNGQAYDYGALYVDSIKLTDITATAGGQVLVSADARKVALYDNNRIYLVWGLAGLIGLIIIISITVKISRRRKSADISQSV